MPRITRFLPAPTFANITSLLALFVALGGTSYAVAKLPKGSVGTVQLRDAAVTSGKLAPGVAISGPRGPRGPRGAQGPAGAAGSDATLPRPEAWRAAAFENGWANYGAPWDLASYRKDPWGVVHLRGLVTRALGTPQPAAIFTLPPGYRPARSRVFTVHTGESPYKAGRVDVYANGAVMWADGATGEADYTSLDGIEFDTDA